MEGKPHKAAFYPIYLSGRKREKMQPVSTMLLHSTKKDWNICILEES